MFRAYHWVFLDLSTNFSWGIFSFCRFWNVLFAIPTHRYGFYTIRRHRRFPSRYEQQGKASIFGTLQIGGARGRTRWRLRTCLTRIRLPRSWSHVPPRCASKNTESQQMETALSLSNHSHNHGASRSYIRPWNVELCHSIVILTAYLGLAAQWY